MIKKFNEFINEDFTDLYKRWKNKDVRKEDNLEIKLKQFLSTKKNPEEYYIENGKVCCKGNVAIFDDDLIDGKLPFQFGKVEGNFIFKCASISTLEGSPKEVGGTFRCSYCEKLESLEGAPEKVEGDFSCSGCEELTSLEGAPQKVVGDFYCYECKLLTSLEGAPKEVGGNFYCCDCGEKFTESDLPKGTIIRGEINT